MRTGLARSIDVAAALSNTAGEVTRGFGGAARITASGLLGFTINEVDYG